MATCVTEQLSNGVRHYVRYREGGRRGGAERKIPFTDAKEAERFRLLVTSLRHVTPDDATLRVLGFGYLVAAPAAADRDSRFVSLVDYAADYIDALECDPNTRRKYTAMVRDYLVPHFGTVDITTLTPRRMRGWQRWMTEQLHLSPKTVRNVRGLLVPMFAASCRRGDDGQPALRDYSPMDGVAPPKPVPYHRELLESAAHARLLFTVAYERDPDAADLLFVLAASGARWGEIAPLDPRGCRLGAAAPHIEVIRKAVWSPEQGWHIEPGAKTRAGTFRRIPVGAPVGRVLARRCADRAPGDLLFPRPYDGGLWHHGNFTRDRWAPIRAEAVRRGLPYHLTLHGLRKSTLTLAAESGVDPVTLGEVAGHASPVTTFGLYTTATGRGHAPFADAVGGFYPDPAEFAA